jgi:hypothetical protein
VPEGLPPEGRPCGPCGRRPPPLDPVLVVALEATVAGAAVSVVVLVVFGMIVGGGDGVTGGKNGSSLRAASSCAERSRRFHLSDIVGRCTVQ